MLKALQSGQPLASSFSGTALREVYRWLEYACISTEALRELLFDHSQDSILGLPAGYPLWAFARGDLPGHVEEIVEDPAVRASLAKAFMLPPHETHEVERKRPVLRDDRIARWYGMTNEVLPILALEGARDRFPTRKAGPSLLSAGRPERPKRRSRVEFDKGATKESSNLPLVRLASAMRSTWDNRLHRRIVWAAIRYVCTYRKRHPGKDKDVTLEKNLKLGKKMARTYLPPTKRLGSAARFDTLRWENPTADAELWRLLLVPDKQQKSYLDRHPNRKEACEMLALVQRAFAPLFGKISWSNRELRIVCDLATAISPISADPGIAFAIIRLNLSPNTRTQLGFSEGRSGYGRE